MQSVFLQLSFSTVISKIKSRKEKGRDPVTILTYRPCKVFLYQGNEPGITVYINRSNTMKMEFIFPLTQKCIAVEKLLYILIYVVE